MSAPRSGSDHFDAQYTRQVRRVVAHLRKIADDIEGMRPPLKDLRDLRLDYHGHAYNIDHKLRWGMANLPFDALLSAATEADRWVRSPEADTEQADR